MMKTWTFPQRRPGGDGPWTSEPDKAQWIDSATGLDCLVVRSGGSGALCGYVGVPPGHPWHGKDYDALDVWVHGGLTFADFCQEGAEDGPGICHVPEPGRPAKVWWLGFDCAHAGDLAPTYQERMKQAGLGHLVPPPYGLPDQYRTFAYVQSEIADLAKQVAEHATEESNPV